MYNVLVSTIVAAVKISIKQTTLLFDKKEIYIPFYESKTIKETYAFISDIVGKHKKSICP